MFLPGVSLYKLLFFSLVVAFVASIQFTQAKSIRSMGYSNLRSSDAIKMRRGGCAAFGHSCFGGHGKRTDTTINTSEPEEAGVGLQPPTDDVRGFIANGGARTPAEIFSRDQPDYTDMNLALSSPYHESEEYLKLSPFFKKWLANSYRRGDLITVNK